jgi:hypothetical protein
MNQQLREDKIKDHRPFSVLRFLAVMEHYLRSAFSPDYIQQKQKTEAEL